MLLRVAADGAVTLEEADNFRGFSVGAAPGVPLARALDGIARLEGDTHAWVTLPRCGALPPGRAAGLGGRLGKMLAYAASKGWTDAEERCGRISRPSETRWRSGALKMIAL
ncbi:hypothetical protein ACFQU7_31985 [Pseudoroseomonas wenyumeiae]